MAKAAAVPSLLAGGYELSGTSRPGPMFPQRTTPAPHETKVGAGRP